MASMQEVSYIFSDEMVNAQLNVVKEFASDQLSVR